ncbi:hypothetical protein DL98DRAFT_583275 [Cadophora sp. DSE1049]|nr:hypothetical protein DL98DRAFT_583275 [Cadophora sp. DSE1049]
MASTSASNSASTPVVQDQPTAKRNAKETSFNAAGMSELVTFLIGSSETKFIIHKKFACEESPVVRAAFNSSFVEGQTQEYTLADSTEATFTLFTEWMYTGNIVNKLAHGTPVAEVGNTQVNLLELWVLADKLLVPQLQTRALYLFDKIRNKFNNLCIYKYKYVWENTQRRLCS